MDAELELREVSSHRFERGSEFQRFPFLSFCIHSWYNQAEGISIVVLGSTYSHDNRKVQLCLLSKLARIEVYTEEGIFVHDNISTTVTGCILIY
jgi:hypothetical protein